MDIPQLYQALPVITQNKLLLFETNMKAEFDKFTTIHHFKRAMIYLYLVR